MVIEAGLDLSAESRHNFENHLVAGISPAEPQVIVDVVQR